MLILFTNFVLGGFTIKIKPLLKKKLKIKMAKFTKNNIIKNNYNKNFSNQNLTKFKNNYLHLL